MTYKIWSAVASCLICGLGLRRNELPVGILAKLTNLLSCYCKLIRITSYKFSLPALGAHINFDLAEHSARDFPKTNGAERNWLGRFVTFTFHNALLIINELGPMMWPVRPI